MKIIDAHLHLFRNPEAEEMAQNVGHHNSIEHLRQVYGELEIVHGVVMGNRSLDPAYHDYPADLFHYCIGLDSSLLDSGGAVIPDLAEKVEANLQRESCCGVKLYPGYNKLRLSDPL
ncbi:MAG: amidohydrolase, partial [Oscillibacter sp.]|nr:amidohydrolase [Oscillibacter sp.]